MRRNPVRKLRDFWWRHEHRAPSMWRILAGKSRYIATPTVAKHRVFVWLDARICPDHQLTVIARDDDTTFGTLHSRFHELWSLRLCTWQGKGNDPRYTPTTTFETFPFPPGLTPNTPATDYESDPRAAAIAAPRGGWSSCVIAGSIHPNGSTKPAPGYPKRPVPRDENASSNLYNARPQWLADAHDALDAAVAAAYGWSAGISNEDALRELLALNGRDL